MSIYVLNTPTSSFGAESDKPHTFAGASLVPPRGRSPIVGPYPCALQATAAKGKHQRGKVVNGKKFCPVCGKRLPLEASPAGSGQ